MHDGAISVQYSHDDIIVDANIEGILSEEVD